MAVLAKLNQARVKFHASDIKKTGHNKFAGYYYFELADFIVPALKIFNEVGLCSLVSFDSEKATMTITDLEDGSQVQITSPMSSAALKGCHEVQNLGAVQTYLRRYLWVTALEIVEHDAVDSSKPLEEKQEKETKQRLPTLTEEEGAHEYNNWIQLKATLVDDEGDADHDMINKEWFKLPSNVRTAITKYGNSLKQQEQK